MKGIKTEEIKLGSGATAEKGKTIVIHYNGYLSRGDKFRSSYDEKEPVTFQVGRRRMIAGLERGVLGKVKLSDGCVSDATLKECLPSKDLVRFRGKLVKKSLSGTVSWHSGDGGRELRRDRVSLRAGLANSSYRKDFKSYEEWGKDHEEMLRRLGPRW